MSKCQLGMNGIKPYELVQWLDASDVIQATIGDLTICGSYGNSVALERHGLDQETIRWSGL